MIFIPACGRNLQFFIIACTEFIIRLFCIAAFCRIWISNRADTVDGNRNLCNGVSGNISACSCYNGLNIKGVSLGNCLRLSRFELDTVNRLKQVTGNDSAAAGNNLNDCLCFYGAVPGQPYTLSAPGIQLSAFKVIYILLFFHQEGFLPQLILPKGNAAGNVISGEAFRFLVVIRHALENCIVNLVNRIHFLKSPPLHHHS